MKNSIEAYMEFSYKGETHAPKVSLDLDVLMQEHGGLGDLHPAIARLSGIDTYSYLYEVMEMHEIYFANATGLAAECMTADGFDTEQFARRWLEQKQLVALGAIAKEHLGLDDLNQHIEIGDALRAAYQLGREAGHKE